MGNLNFTPQQFIRTGAPSDLGSGLHAFTWTTEDVPDAPCWLLKQSRSRSALSSATIYIPAGGRLCVQVPTGGTGRWHDVHIQGVFRASVWPPFVPYLHGEKLTQVERYLPRVFRAMSIMMCVHVRSSRPPPCLYLLAVLCAQHFGG